MIRLPAQRSLTLKSIYVCPSCRYRSSQFSTRTASQSILPVPQIDRSNIDDVFKSLDREGELQLQKPSVRRKASNSKTEDSKEPQPSQSQPNISGGEAIEAVQSEVKLQNLIKLSKRQATRLKQLAENTLKTIQKAERKPRSARLTAKDASATQAGAEGVPEDRAPTERVPIKRIPAKRISTKRISAKRAPAKDESSKNGSSKQASTAQAKQEPSTRPPKKDAKEEKEEREEKQEKQFTTEPLSPKKSRRTLDVSKIRADQLKLRTIDIEQPTVRSLSYGLDRVLFNPGVYNLQDSRSRVYNFDPYLQTIMPIEEFDFGALKEFITSSKDTNLAQLARKLGKRYVGSTSSMTSVLSQFHFLLSAWREINTGMLSKGFPEKLHTFTLLTRAPTAFFLRHQDGIYALDGDKEYDRASVLSSLGQSMEKLLTLPTDQYERYRKTHPDGVSREMKEAPESYHYSTLANFVMRSQLDAYDPRLPGSGMFDLKTRAVVSVRMDAQNYGEMKGYEIKGRFGQWESYEKEYHDMIRSVFLKYSLQVRIGNMDGIFVAFHNTERIFGFQYISLPELDLAIHGQANLALGDQEFRLSVELFSNILDKATARFPGQSIRFYFETREGTRPFMYVFAEPVSESDIERIQTGNVAQIEEIEQKILGLQDPSLEKKTSSFEEVQNEAKRTMEEHKSAYETGNSLDTSQEEPQSFDESHQTESNAHQNNIRRPAKGEAGEKSPIFESVLQERRLLDLLGASVGFLTAASRSRSLRTYQRTFFPGERLGMVKQRLIETYGSWPSEGALQELKNASWETRESSLRDRVSTVIQKINAENGPLSESEKYLELKLLHSHIVQHFWDDHDVCEDLLWIHRHESKCMKRPISSEWVTGQVSIKKCLERRISQNQPTPELGSGEPNLTHHHPLEQLRVQPTTMRVRRIEVRDRIRKHKSSKKLVRNVRTNLSPDIDYHKVAPPRRYKSFSLQAENQPPTTERISKKENELSASEVENQPPTTEQISKEENESSVPHEEKPLLAMTLTVRNQVNGVYVIRPENLSYRESDLPISFPTSSSVSINSRDKEGGSSSSQSPQRDPRGPRTEKRWSVEYILEEIESNESAWKLYDACKERRKNLMSQEEREVTPWSKTYIDRLREMSRKGREWRQERDETERKAGLERVVLGRDPTIQQ